MNITIFLTRPLHLYQRPDSLYPSFAILSLLRCPKSQNHGHNHLPNTSIYIYASVQLLCFSLICYTVVTKVAGNQSLYLWGGAEVTDLQVIRDAAAVAGDVGVADGEVTMLVCGAWRGPDVVHLVASETL